MNTKKELTGYPSIDKPWLKYYNDAAITTPLPKKTMYQFAYDNNIDNMKKTALQYFGTTISFDKFFENIRKSVSSFKHFGIGKGDIVTIISMQTPETIYAIYALDYIGAIADLVYMNLSSKELHKNIVSNHSKMLIGLDVVLPTILDIKDNINIPVIIVSVADSMPLPIKTGYCLKNKPIKHPFTTFDSFIKTGVPEKGGLCDCDSEKCAVIVHTSGTTGIPKGVMLSDDCLNAVVFQLIFSGKDYKNDETAFLMLPPFIGFGISMLHLFICTGMTSILWINLDVNAIAKEFERTKPNRFASGPAVVEAIMKQCTSDLNFLIDFTGGGESLSIEKEREVNKFLLGKKSSSKYLTGYGMTELSAVVAMNQNNVYREGSVGIPLPRTIAKVIDTDSGKELQCGNEGELCFSAPNLMIGYYNNEISYNEIVETDANNVKWLHTGDLGLIDKDGFIFIKGRIKRIFIAKGKDNMVNKLFPQRIEELFENQNYIDRCGVIVKPDNERLNIAIAFITANKKETQCNISEIKSRLFDLSEHELPEHMRPSQIIIIDSMPYSTSGKIDYRALEKMEEENE